MSKRKSQFTKSEKTLDNSKLAQSCPEISQGEISVRKDKPTNPTGLKSPLPNGKNTQPPFDVDKLAQQWCQLLMEQAQEERCKRTIRSAFHE
ncbi:MAG: hypothetical protein NUV65_06685 [Candidatus Roizmanbacteria bacterium]|nr:hypothetical protein [Candidatus Roizmanbacteria bacterium]